MCVSVGRCMRGRRLTDAFAAGPAARCEGACEENFASAWLAVEQDIAGGVRPKRRKASE